MHAGRNALLQAGIATGPALGSTSTPAAGDDTRGGCAETLSNTRIVVAHSRGRTQSDLCKVLASAGCRDVRAVDSAPALLELLHAQARDGNAGPEILIAQEWLPGGRGVATCELLESEFDWQDLDLLMLVEPARLKQKLDEYASTPAVFDIVTRPFTRANLVTRVLSAAKRAQERFGVRHCLDIADAMVLALDASGQIRLVNRRGCEVLGYQHRELFGADWFRTCIPGSDRAVRIREFYALLNGEASQGEQLEHRVLTRSGDERMIAWDRASPWLDQRGGVVGVLCSGQDVTETRSISAQLSWHATHDPLTGLLNRRELERRLARALEDARSDEVEHALCYVDIDQFKVINDSYGHDAGNELLRQLGALLPEQVRRRDVGARLGGDEFAVLMERCTLNEALHAATTMQRSVEAFRFNWNGQHHRISISMGLVAIDADSESGAAVLGAAEASCLSAKNKGGGRIHIYHPDDTELMERQGEMRWVLQIHRALEEERLQLWMQPIRAVHADIVHEHFELLVRMVDDDGRIIMPGAFLPAAERFNLSGRIDRWVVGTAFAWLARHRLQLRRLNLCGINLSGMSLADEDFLDFIVGELRRHPIPAERICFEITETAAIANMSAAIRFITTLKAEGVRFALDDFGSGLSSFAYLRNLPVDFLKIDGVFVKDIDENPIDYAMVKSIHEVAQVMGKETIGEFVERDSVLTKLREIGVHYAQGYAVGRPRPLDEVLRTC